MFLYVCIFMTEQDALRRQKINGQKEFYLINVGQYWRAYGNGAFALNRACGYKVFRRQQTTGEGFYSEFPRSAFNRVKERISFLNGTLREVDSKTYIFYGFDGTHDLSLVQQVPVSFQAPSPVQEGLHLEELLTEILSFNLTSSTPVDAMMFIIKMQKKYGPK